MWRWGVSSSSKSKKPIPKRNPTAAGITDHTPPAFSSSIAGMRSDHTEAATITPEAKPNNDFWRRGDISSFIKKTKAAPNIVPSRGMRSPMANVITAYVLILLLR